MSIQNAPYIYLSTQTCLFYSYLNLNQVNSKHLRFASLKRTLLMKKTYEEYYHKYCVTLLFIRYAGVFSLTLGPLHLSIPLKKYCILSTWINT